MDISFQTYLTYLGAIIVIYLFHNLFYELFLYLLPEKNLKEIYGNWVAITGSTDGIGKELAFQFGEKGYNICLISRNLQKLQATEKELKEKYGKIQTKIIVLDLMSFSKLEDVEKISGNLLEQLNGLNIGIFINNAGVLDISELNKQKEEKILEQINVNCLATAFLAQIFIKYILKKREKLKSLLLIVSSGSAYKPFPFYSVYGASKAFTKTFSEALQYEENLKNIYISCVTPHFVQTQMTNHNSKIQLNISTKESAASIIRMLGKKTNFIGHWKHIIHVELINILGSFLPSNKITDKFEYGTIEKILKKIKQ